MRRIDRDATHQTRLDRFGLDDRAMMSRQLMTDLELDPRALRASRNTGIVGGNATR